MNFNFDEALKIANNLTYSRMQRNLTDVETAIIEGAWHKLDYGKIAEENNYTLSYISQDVAPKLWKLLSEALGERVKKNNFKRTNQKYTIIFEHFVTQTHRSKQNLLSFIVTEFLKRNSVILVL